MGWGADGEVCQVSIFRAVLGLSLVPWCELEIQHSLKALKLIKVVMNLSGKAHSSRCNFLMPIYYRKR